MRDQGRIIVEVPIFIEKEKNYYIASAPNKFISQGKTKEKVINNIKKAFKLNSINENVEYSFKVIND